MTLVLYKDVIYLNVYEPDVLKSLVENAPRLIAGDQIFLFFLFFYIILYIT